MTRLERAKKQSLVKWDAVLEAYPNFDEMENVEDYHGCGFCREYCVQDDKNKWVCGECPLGKSVGRCNREGKSDLYYRILAKFCSGDLRGLKVMIKHMIKAIEEATE